MSSPKNTEVFRGLDEGLIEDRGTTVKVEHDLVFFLSNTTQ